MSLRPGSPLMVADQLLPVLFSQRRVLLEGSTDQPDTADDNAPAGDDHDAGVVVERGVFVCALGGLPLFSSEDSLLPLDGVTRRGWPGFCRPVHPDHVVRDVEGQGMERATPW